ncbi:uncharacterized protein CANTADRAFT_218589 [Suhomyces tanzawaensis NRRL Y-17324]|uniref:Uncharacterized protein n=1 Tax=Suhomyces tanzawaensis NRRL Y-17324 TaxID=984487 RepID=A0A1E4SK78_9ASCO|nr:uncharacterized protein CANTADRAFT_218589 [Suhomyces tanzawaensis NRRL Y-17324]ODV79898.1 hypothetical protein CANTADRAFT_218589 [Suhomyces tanzawaensis NRRL Y-17324]
MVAMANWRWGRDESGDAGGYLLFIWLSHRHVMRYPGDCRWHGPVVSLVPCAGRRHQSSPAYAAGFVPGCRHSGTTSAPAGNVDSGLTPQPTGWGPFQTRLVERVAPRGDDRPRLAEPVPPRLKNIPTASLSSSYQCWLPAVSGATHAGTAWNGATL